MSQAIRINVPGGVLQADLTVPVQARGLVIFCHGTGSDRRSPRNVLVAKVLQQAGIATLLVDMAPGDARSNPSANHQLERARHNLLAVVDWTANQQDLSDLPLGLFGSSSGAAVALDVAALRPDRILAIVSRGGRPDLAFESLGMVRCPTLLIVGSADVDVLELNAWAAAHLRASHDLLVIAGASHLFAEPGALQQVAEASCAWFERQLSRSELLQATSIHSPINSEKLQHAANQPCD